MDEHFPLVLVRWRDATTFYGWRNATEAKNLEPREIETSGFLINTTKKYLSLAASVGVCDEEGHGGADFADVFVIPRQWVLEMEVLGIVENKEGD